MKTLIWFREDLRLYDNPALHHGASMGEVLPVFIYPQGLGGASYWWLHHSLLRLMAELSARGLELILKTGEPHKVLADVCRDAKIDQLVWNRVYSPKGIEQGLRVKAQLNTMVDIASFNGQLLIEPTQVMTKKSTPFKVFTPFWRACRASLNPSPLVEVPKLTGVKHAIASESIDDWGMQPRQPDWSGGLAQRWQPGEQGAQQRWASFLPDTLAQYSQGRDFPAKHNTSYLSPHLAFGEISPKQIWFDTLEALANNVIDSQNANKFLSELGWREFSRYLLVHFPHMIDQPFNNRFREFPWQDNDKLLKLWKKGLTGYPIVDAGMRELWHTGYMHNRVRMITASFLTKHCLTHWQSGMEWFWDTLVDADIANNTVSWQWASGCGADAAPYYRIFNPILQGEKFDKEGDYIKHWIPELRELPQKYISKPWEADIMTLNVAGVRLGENYPHPIVDHKQAREKALRCYQAMHGPSE